MGREFGDSSLNFTVRFWSKLDDRLQVRSALNALINDEFTRNGIVIPFPQRDVNLKVEGGISSLASTPQEAAKAAVTNEAAK